MEASPPGAGVVADRASLQVWASPRLDVSDFFWQTGGSGAVAAMAAPSGLPGYLAVGNGRGRQNHTYRQAVGLFPFALYGSGLCQVIRRYYRRRNFFSALVDWVQRVNDSLTAPAGDPLEWVLGELEQNHLLLVIESV